MKSIKRLHDIIRRHGLSIELRRTSRRLSEINGRGGVGVHHYECRLKKPGREMKINLIADPTEDKVTACDVLFVLAMDASACAMLEGFEAFQEEMHDLLADSSDDIPSGVDSFLEEYEKRCTQSRRLRDFLGENAYEELREHADWPPGSG